MDVRERWSHYSERGWQRLHQTLAMGKEYLNTHQARNILHSSLYSFNVSVLCSGIRYTPFYSALFGATASAVHQISMVAFSKLFHRIQIHLQRDIPQTQEMSTLCTFIISWGGTMYLVGAFGSILGYQLNYKLSFWFSVPIYLMNMFRGQNQRSIPIYGFALMR
ncbi:MAG: hypothetical protein Tsb0021_13770 [Chlamydiales bacterium]